MKIKFKCYDIKFEGHTYCILIPPNTEQLWITGYGSKVWGLNWEGNRDGLEALLYSMVILGFNPVDKIIYFPIRKNAKTEYDKNIGGNGNMHGNKDTYINECDLVFTTHQVAFKRGKWKKLKQCMRFVKPSTYVLDYDEKRTESYFGKSVEKWKNTTAGRRKEYAMEIMQDDTLFHIFSKMLFRQSYLQLNMFLKEDLEEWFECEYEGRHTCVWDSIWLDSADFPYRKKKQMVQHPWVMYYDMKYEDRIRAEDEKETSEKGNNEKSTVYENTKELSE